LLARPCLGGAMQGAGLQAIMKGAQQRVGNSCQTDAELATAVVKPQIGDGRRTVECSRKIWVILWFSVRPAGLQANLLSVGGTST
jgi:hypothetical protein